MSHDATRCIGFGFMKPVSSCVRAKACCKRLLKVPCDCFYDRALLYSCNLLLDDEIDLPYIYWIQKMHKNPYTHRFIAGSSKCSTKPLSILLTNCLPILSKVFRSTAKQPTPEVGSIRCGSSRIQRSY